MKFSPRRRLPKLHYGPSTQQLVPYGSGIVAGWNMNKETAYKSLPPLT